jgi:5-methylcytosine-specific restriction protein A
VFEKDRIYRRRDIHALYGEQQQGGISTPKKLPVIFIFTGDSGKLYGYKDDWNEDGLFHYTGEGQEGNMEYRRGNQAVRDHVKNRERLFLFRAKGDGDVKCLGQMEYVEDYPKPGVPDLNGNLRNVIVFKLRPVNG